MAADIIERYTSASEVLSRANEILGIDLRQFILEGPDEALEATDVCQPAIFTASVAVIEALKSEKGLRETDFIATAGLSLGEYTALWFAGALSFDDALRLVRMRGQAMQEASEENPSGMLSLLGADAEKAQALARAGSEAGVLVTANFLGPGSIALSGATAAIDLAESKLSDFGIKRAVRLKVAGAFHSPLMASAADRLGNALAGIDIREPVIPFYSNVSATVVHDPDEIRQNLADQITNPVLWADTMKNFELAGVTSALEPAPGNVLTGLLRRGAPGISGISVRDVNGVEAYE